MGHVDADHSAGVADLPRGEKTIESGTTTEIDDDLARLHGCNCLRVAAAKPEIGPLGDRGQFGLGIAHPSRLVVRSGFGAATGRGCRSATASLACLRGDAAIARAHHFLDLRIIHDLSPYAAVVFGAALLQPTAGSQTGAQTASRPQQFSVR